MTLEIPYQSEAFPSSYSFRPGTLTTTWDELLWAALTIGRPSAYHVFRHGPASFHEAIFRLALIRMAVERDWNGHLRRTDAYAALDPTEKGMVSYFLGMALCKLFAAKLLQTPWLLHLDVFRNGLAAVNLGRSRPDLVCEDNHGNWHAFESKGRSSAPSAADKVKAKAQAQRLVSVGGTNCTLHIGTIAYFRNNSLAFYWRDPEADADDQIPLPNADQSWRYYYEPTMSLLGGLELKVLDIERQMTDVTVKVHPEILDFLGAGDWLGAKQHAQKIRVALTSDGYQLDGLKITAGQSWNQPYQPRERV